MILFLLVAHSDEKGSTRGFVFSTNGLCQHSNLLDISHSNGTVSRSRCKLFKFPITPAAGDKSGCSFIEAKIPDGVMT